MAIETYRVETPPDNRAYGPHVEAGILRGNAGSLVIINLRRGDLAEHSHEQEHVGVVLEGEFSFTSAETEVVLRAGDLYKVPAFQPHGVRCRERAVIAQVREPAGAGQSSGQSSGQGCGCGSGCGCR